VHLAAGYDAASWTNFAIAEVGAAAALAGLLVVAASINLERIIAYPSVIQRLGVTLSMFTGVLIVGTFLLVPAQNRWLLGLEIGLVGALLAGMSARYRGRQEAEAEHPEERDDRPAIAVLLAAITISAAIAIAIAGLGYATQTLGGLYWLVPALVVVFCVGLINAWVALVEVLR
jgi:hypothetical protein